jgi:hypothetical protein
MSFDMTRFPELNTATKYPSIETYHVLGERGALTEELGPFAGVGEYEKVYVTEKVDGTNGRIVLLPGGDYFIGSREELLYAKGDRVKTPNLSIVPALFDLAERLSKQHTVDCIEVLYLEVYGGKIGGQAKQYSRQNTVGYRLFDHAFIGTAILYRSREDISRWRDNGGQSWQEVEQLQSFGAEFGVPVVPYLDTWLGTILPLDVDDTYEALQETIGESTQVHLDTEDGTGGRAEGLVLRTADRSRIAKARFQDYERTLKRRQQQKK